MCYARPAICIDKVTAGAKRYPIVSSTASEVEEWTFAPFFHPKIRQVGRKGKEGSKSVGCMWHSGARIQYGPGNV